MWNVLAIFDAFRAMPLDPQNRRNSSASSVRSQLHHQPSSLRMTQARRTAHPLAPMPGIRPAVGFLAAAQEAHGVIAFGTETDQGNVVAYGFAWNFPAKDTAHAEAMNACMSGGGTDCIQLA